PNALPMEKEGHWWIAKVDMSGNGFPVAYKYVVLDSRDNSFIRYEDGDNRLIHGDAPFNKLTILHDGFVHLPNDTWKGAAVAIPAFCLPIKTRFGVGEFPDLALLVVGVEATGLPLIHVLPSNVLLSTVAWADYYPYTAITAFALLCNYLHLE